MKLTRWRPPSATCPGWTTSTWRDQDTLAGLLNVDRDLWREEVRGIREFYARFGGRLPAELARQLEELEDRLG